jgi:phage tail tape-measure protein
MNNHRRNGKRTVHASVRVYSTIQSDGTKEVDEIEVRPSRKGAITGTIAGSAAGATLGNIVPVVGPIVGAIGGGIMGGAIGFVFGPEDK